jgi:predicted amidohydrolase YtcJ
MRAHSPARRRLIGAGAGLALAPGRAPAQIGDLDLVVHNARVATPLPGAPPTALGVRSGRIAALGTDHALLAFRTPRTVVIDAGGRRLIPGLIDAHGALLAAGRGFGYELRWDGLDSLHAALARLGEQALHTPPGHWVRVVGGWTEHQWSERRMPELAELDAVAPRTPVCVQLRRERVWINRAGARALGWGAAAPPGVELVRDAAGIAGALVHAARGADPAALLERLPRPTPAQRASAVRHYIRELNRLGVTTLVDVAEPGVRYPEDYALLAELHRDGRLDLRVAVQLAAAPHAPEAAQFETWARQPFAGPGDQRLRLLGAAGLRERGAAAEHTLRVLARHRWSFRIDAPDDDALRPMLEPLERVHRESPLNGVPWVLDGAERLSAESLVRARRMTPGICLLPRLAFTGEARLESGGARALEHAPALAALADSGLRIAAGSGDPRIGSYNPWLTYWWLISGRALSGAQLRSREDLMTRERALRALGTDAAWFAQLDGQLGTLAPGQLADFALLNADPLGGPEQRALGIESLLTVSGGRVVHAAGPYAGLAPAAPPIDPPWSPLARFGAWPRRPAGADGAPAGETVRRAPPPPA